MEYRLSEYSPKERKVDDREGQCNVWYNATLFAALKFQDHYASFITTVNRLQRYTLKTRDNSKSVLLDVVLCS
ncbi:hypothetical protein TNCV_2955771 [Trichonephila clavipes]|nr:hypothetical protein TNCV_2955771 [Trichonephila clavipes]